MHIALHAVLEKILFQRLLQIKLTLFQALEEKRIEHPAFSLQDHAHGFIMGKSRLVHPFAGQGIIHIRQSDHLSGNRDRVPYESVGIAAPVIALMMPAADLVGRLKQVIILSEGNVLQHESPGFRMRLHDFKLFLREAARLIQDLSRNGYLADVMQRGSHGNRGNVRTGQCILLCFFDQALQQHTRRRINIHDVKAALLVPELDDMGQHHDQQTRSLFILIDFALHDRAQLFLLDVEHDRIFHALLHDQEIKRP